MKVVKLYITQEDIKDKLGEQYKNHTVIFTNNRVCMDGSLEFECLLVKEEEEEDIEEYMSRVKLL